MARLVLLVVVLVLATGRARGVGRRAGAGAGVLAAVGLARGARDRHGVRPRAGVVRRPVDGSAARASSDVTTTAAWLEVVSVGVLAVALALVVVPVVLPGPSAALEHRVSFVLRRLTSRSRSGRDGWRVTRGSRDRPSTGPVAALRDDAPPGNTHTPPVGLSDDPD